MTYFTECTFVIKWPITVILFLNLTRSRCHIYGGILFRINFIPLFEIDDFPISIIQHLFSFLAILPKTTTTTKTMMKMLTHLLSTYPAAVTVLNVHLYQYEFRFITRTCSPSHTEDHVLDTRRRPKSTESFPLLSSLKYPPSA